MLETKAGVQPNYVDKRHWKTLLPLKIYVEQVVGWLAEDKFEE